MHIYEKLENGEIIPRHFTRYAKPRMNGDQEILRPATLSDFKKWHKEGQRVAPSVTTLLDIFAKHALIDWKIKEHLKVVYKDELETGTLLPLIRQGREDDFIKEVKRLTELQMDKAPSAGTNFHKDMERYIKNVQTLEDVDNSLCASVANLIYDKTGKDIGYWQPEVNIFSDPGYAGQCDLFIPRDFDSQDKHSWVIDYKTKQFAKQWKPKKMGYWDSHAAQLAAYGMELDVYFNAVNIFVCLETGEVEWHQWDQKDLTRGWELFQLALQAWQLKNL